MLIKFPIPRAPGPEPKKAVTSLRIISDLYMTSMHKCKEKKNFMIKLAYFIFSEDKDSVTSDDVQLTGHHGEGRFTHHYMYMCNRLTAPSLS